MKVTKRMLAWNNKKGEKEDDCLPLISLFRKRKSVGIFVILFFLLTGLTELQAENLPPVKVRALPGECPVQLEEYRRDLDFENNIINNNPLCMPDYINIDKFRYTFSLSKNLHEQCIKGNMTDEQSVKYALIGIASVAASGGTLAPAVVSYFGGELVTDVVKCTSKALVGTFDSISEDKRSFLQDQIDNIASLKDWESFIGNTNVMLKSVDKIKASHGSVEAFLALRDRQGEANDFVNFLAEMYGTGEQYVKDKIYGKVANHFEDAQRAKDQCRFDRSEAYLKKARKAAENNCLEAGKWFRYTEARLGVETTDPAFRLYWKRLLDYHGASTLPGDMYLRCNYKTLKERTFKNSKDDLARSSKELSDIILKVQNRRDLILRRKNALARKKQQVNHPINEAIRALNNQDYAAACKLIDDPPISKILKVWSHECHLRFRNDGLNPLEMVGDIQNEINVQSAKLRKQILSLIKHAMNDINSCLLSKLNSARASLQMADELSAKLLVADENGCRKYVPDTISQKLSEGYRMIEAASSSNMEDFLRKIDAGIQPARKALRDCEGMFIFADLKRLKAELAKKRCQGTLGISVRLKEIESLEKTIDPENCSGKGKKECDIAPTTTDFLAARACEVRQRFWGYGHGCFTEDKIADLKAEDGTTIKCGAKCILCPKGFIQGIYNGSKVCMKCPKGKHFRNGCCR